MKEVFLSIGTNLGNRERNLSNALGMLAESTGRISASSSVYETEPWGFDSEDRFLNMVVKVNTVLTPRGLLEKTEWIESVLGRIRNEKRYSSRIIDIDILFYEDQVIDEVNLKIPHPRIAERRFILVPLCEIAPELMHPVIQETVSSLLESCADNCKVLIKGPLPS
jgi:2-amino-4-hydroxy-6-hydroxymethyldihydropteridine diphosphokinase